MLGSTGTITLLTEVSASGTAQNLNVEFWKSGFLPLVRQTLCLLEYILNNRHFDL